MAPNTLRLAAKMLARSPDAKRLTVGAVSVMVPKQDQDENMDDGTGNAMKVRDLHLLVAAGSVPLSRGARVTYDGASYEIRDTYRQENGDVIRVQVVPV
jgi:hypothetical protein